MVLFVFSCNNKEHCLEDINSPKVENGKIEVGKGENLDLLLQGEYLFNKFNTGDDLRGLIFPSSSENGKFPVTIPDEGGEVLCLLRSDDPNDPISYERLHFDKDPSASNKIKISTKIELNPSIKKVAGKKWYFLGIIGGSWNEASKTLDFSALQKLNLMGTNEQIELDIPAISDWTELPPVRQDTDGCHLDYELDEAGQVKPIHLKFFTQGLLLRYHIRANNTGHRLKVKGFKCVSSVFAFQASYELSKDKLKSLDFTPDDRCTNLLSYTLGNPSAEKFFPHSNETVQEFQKDFLIDGGLELDNAQESQQYVMFWAMPTGVETAQYRTAVYLDAELQGANNLEKSSFKFLPAYYSNHEAKLISSGNSFAIVSASVKRPKLPIEYMAKHNLASLQKYNKNSDGHWVLKEGRYKLVEGCSTNFAKGYNHKSFTDVRWDEFNAVANDSKLSTWHLPSVKEFAGVLPMSSGAILSLKANNGGDYSIPSQIKATNENATMQVRVKNTANDKAYTIQHLADERMLACRFSWEDNPDQMVQSQNSNKLLEIRMLYDFKLGGTFSGLYRRWFWYENVEKHAPSKKYLKITARYLAPNFSRVASIDDVANDEFWANHNDDDIIRYLTPAYSNLGTQEGRGNRYPPILFLSPDELCYWTTIPSGSQDYKTLFFSGDKGNIHSKKLNKNLKGAVRLFSNQ